MEKQVFSRRKILFENLENCGFIRTKEGYFLEKEILPAMLAQVFISRSGDLSGRIFDTEIKEPYTLFRDPSAQGAFVMGVKNAYYSFLTELVEKISVPKAYISDQANWVNWFIKDRFNVSAEYLWKKFPHFGVYRNIHSGKWFGIIMNISKGKLIKGESGEVEVMNLKTDDKSDYYIEKGALPCYHMNQKSWVSVLLDGSLSNDLIEEMLELSFLNSEKVKRKTK